MKNFVMNVWRKFKRTKRKTEDILCYAILERELRQRRITEKWTINMLSDYYGCTEIEMRNILDTFSIK